MLFPVLAKNQKEAEGLRCNNDMIPKRCVECIFGVAQTLICHLRRANRGDDVKLRYIIVYDCHNGANDWFSVCTGISRSGYATEYRSLTVPSDTKDMRFVFRDLFENYAEVEDTFDSEAKLNGICLNLVGFGKEFLRDFGRYIRTVEEMMDSDIITPYGFINPFGIPKDAFTKMREEFEELIYRYC